MTNPPKEIMVWCSHEKMGHIGTWATTRYPEDSVAYIPKSEFNKVKEAAELGLQMAEANDLWYTAEAIQEALDT